jgi:peroxiredoxin
VLVFAGDSATEGEFLQEVTNRGRAFAQQEAVVIAIFSHSQQTAGLLKTWAEWPFLVLLDDGGRVHRLYGAVDEHGRHAPIIYVTARHSRNQT